MAWKSERTDCVSSSMVDSSNYHVTSTPYVPSSAVNVGDSGYSTEIKPKPSFGEQHVDLPPLNLDISELCDHTETQSKAAYAVLSDRSADCISLESTDYKLHTVLSNVTNGYFMEFEHSNCLSVEQRVDIFPPQSLDKSEEEKIYPACDHIHSRSKACADCINLESTDTECRTRFSDVPSSYSHPDVVDQLASIVCAEPESRSLTRHSTCFSVHEQHSVSHPEPSRIAASLSGDVINQLFCMPPVAAVTLRYVSDRDLCRMCCVCHSWKQAVCDDKVSHERRLRYLELQAMNKENIEVKSCVARAVTSASRPLSSIQTTCRSLTTDRSDVCTDASLQRCRRYWQIGSTLAPGQRLSKCPRCESPVCTVKDVAQCTNEACDYAACVDCRELYHAPAPCRQRPAWTPAAIGSRASKKRLKRL